MQLICNGEYNVISLSALLKTNDLSNKLSRRNHSETYKKRKKPLMENLTNISLILS